MASTFDADTSALLDGKIFPSVATLGPDGSPRSSVVWAKRDADTVVFATGKHSRKGRDLARDPPIALSVTDPENPYRVVEIRGRAQLQDEGADALLQEFGQRYLGRDYPDVGDERVLVRLAPEKVVKFGF